MPRSSASYEREIAGLEKALNDESKNSYRLSRENGRLREAHEVHVERDGDLPVSCSVCAEADDA